MPIYDLHALEHARARADTRGGSFLDAHIWDDVADRLTLLHRAPQVALLLGPLTPAAQLFAHHARIDITTDPDHAEGVDLLLAVRWAEAEDDLPGKLAALAVLLPPNTPLIGASIGGDSLAALRLALVAADREDGAVAPRSHPRIDPSAFAELLQRAGFAQPVVDVDRVRVRYSSVQRLVDDLRDLGATNALATRPRRPVGKAWRGRLEAAFPPGTEEQFDVVNFSAWTVSR